MGKYFANDNVRYRHQDYDEIRKIADSYVPSIEEYIENLGLSKKQAKAAREAKVDANTRALIGLRDGMRQCFLQNVDDTAIQSIVAESGNNDLKLIEKYAFAGFDEIVTYSKEEYNQKESEFMKAIAVLRRIMRKDKPKGE